MSCGWVGGILMFGTYLRPCSFTPAGKAVGGVAACAATDPPTARPAAATMATASSGNLTFMWFLPRGDKRPKTTGCPGRVRDGVLEHGLTGLNSSVYGA